MSQFFRPAIINLMCFKSRRTAWSEVLKLIHHLDGHSIPLKGSPISSSPLESLPTQQPGWRGNMGKKDWCLCLHLSSDSLWISESNPNSLSPFEASVKMPYPLLWAFQQHWDPDSSYWPRCFLSEDICPCPDFCLECYS